MNTSISFRVNYAPVPQPRPRARVMFVGKRPTAQVYEDTKHPCTLWRIRVLDAWRLAMPSPGFRFEGPLAVSLELVMGRAKAMKQSGRIWDTRSGGKYGGDVDNLAKSILDALNGKAWHDDGQVTQLSVAKYVAAEGENPHAQVRIQTAAEIRLDKQHRPLFQ